MVTRAVKAVLYPRRVYSHPLQFHLALVCCLLVAITVKGEDPVFIPDPSLKERIEEVLGVPDPTPSDMLGLIKLRCSRLDIEEITGLEWAENLYWLSVRFNDVVTIEPLRQLYNLEHLDASQNRITDLSPLSGLSQLRGLNLHGNRIRDISTLSGLSRLEFLELRKNLVSDISPLANLTSLTHLNLNEGDRLSDISTLAGLENLETLTLSVNWIRDISALAHLEQLSELELRSNLVQSLKPLIRLSHLRRLDLRYNPSLPNEAYADHLYQIVHENPGIALKYSPNTNRPQEVIASQGIYADRIVVTWNEVPQGPLYPSYYQISRTDPEGTWTAVVGAWQTATTFVDTTALPGEIYSYQIQGSADDQGLSKTDISDSVKGWRAVMKPTVQTYFVDDNAPHDPGPNDIHLSDPAEDGTVLHPFDCIQEAVAFAAEGSVIQIQPGTYFETIDFLGKALELNGGDPNTLLPYPIIDGRHDGGPVIQLTGPSMTGSRLSGLIITGGRGTLSSTLFCSQHTVTLDRCCLVGNRAADPNGATVRCTDASLTMTHCTVTDNLCGERGAAVVAVDSDLHLINSILSGNVPAPLRYQGLTEPEVKYCTITGGWPFDQVDVSLERGNIDQDPLFAQAGYWLSTDLQWVPGDYHLQSRAGRWEPDSRSWVQDPESSPCIDGGDPEADVAFEPWPHGHIVNCGAYGGSAQASFAD